MKNSISLKNKTYQLSLRLALFIFYTALIFLVSHQRTFSSVTTFSYEDKVKHFAEYFVYAIFTISLLKKLSPNKYLLKTIVFCALYAITDEVHQGFIGYFETGIFSGIRDCSFADWVADLLGAITGAFFYVKFSPIFKSFLFKKDDTKNING